MNVLQKGCDKKSFGVNFYFYETLTNTSDAYTKKKRTAKTFVMLCAIWYHLYNLKNVKNTHGGVLILVKLQATKINTSPWMFFHVF